MLADIVIGTVIFVWFGFCVYTIIKRKINAKKNGGCSCGCSGCSSGKCSRSDK